MKRLFLILALAFSAPALAGDLGASDHVMYGVNAISPDFSKTTFQVAIDVNTVRKFKPKSTLTFENGRLFVRSSPEAVLGLRKRGHISEKEEINELGITPAQVQSFSYNTAFGVIFSVFYKDSRGQYELATWLIDNENDAKAFKRAFLNWMSVKPAPVGMQPEL